jgi:hypothetical protein
MAQLSTTKVTSTAAMALPIGTSAQRPIQRYVIPGTYTWTAPTGVTSVQLLLVGGGGGGGSWNSGGGGGAGAVYYNSAVAVTPGNNYTIVVGAGGGPSTGSSPATGYTNGGNSTAFGYTCLGGGYGGGNGNGNNGNPGGSGGAGGTASAVTGGSSTQNSTYGYGLGFAGGNSTTNNSPYYAGGGGGGAGGVGVTATAGQAGAGGTGVAYSITGISTYYGGGGGGSCQNGGGYGGYGGIGGGGNGGGNYNNYIGYPGQPGTGGGGGAGGYGTVSGQQPQGNWLGNSSLPGGAGGSGTVIISTLATSVSPVGMMRFNSDIGDIELWDGQDWTAFVPFNGTITAQLSSPSKTGPSSIINAYTGDLANRVTMTSGIQNLTIPYTGLYRIGAYGAQGGCNTLHRGGAGAAAIGDFYLKAGQVIKCLVGSTGALHTTDCDSGGGGGTYVLQAPYNTTDSILVIGGGGGGASNGSYTGTSGSRTKLNMDGSDGKDAPGSYIAGVSAGGPSGVNGYAGSRVSSSAGNPGGGFFGGGGSGVTNPTWTSTSAGYSFLDGANGGNSNNANSYGGWGGGGGGHGDCFISGGGGGGYNGGGPQIQYTSRHGGAGGSSYNNGLNQQNIMSSNYNPLTNVVGNMGYVTIQRIR